MKVLITGTNRGIGLQMVKSAVSKQWRVFACCRNPHEAEKLSEVTRMSGGLVSMHTLDIADKAQIQALAYELRNETFDILINNAGITRDGLLMRMKDEDWDLVMDINLKAAFQLSRAAIKGMMRRRHGRIISITSVVGVTGNPGQANYAASKAGMIGFSKALAREVASRNITVNCIAPGFIETAMTDALNEKQKQAILTSIPAGRLGTAGEVASAAVYLSSGEAAYMTGQTLHVNGGMAMI